GELQAYGRAAKEMRGGRDAAGQIVEQFAGIGGADAHMHQSHLTIADVDGAGICLDRSGTYEPTRLGCVRLAAATGPDIHVQQKIPMPCRPWSRSWLRSNRKDAQCTGNSRRLNVRAF